jgi:hypothetical protein
MLASNHIIDVLWDGDLALTVIQLIQNSIYSLSFFHSLLLQNPYQLNSLQKTILILVNHLKTLNYLVK